MKLTIKTMTIAAFITLIAGVASANTFFSEDAWEMLENRDSQKRTLHIISAEGYSETETNRKVKIDQGNTFFSIDEWEMLENW
jgi:hypothetical protein